MTFLASMFSAGLSMMIFGFVLNKYEKEERNVPAAVAIIIISLVVCAFYIFIQLAIKGAVIWTIK